MDLAQENEIFRQKSFFEKVGMVDKKKQKKIIIDVILLPIRYLDWREDQEYIF